MIHSLTANLRFTLDQAAARQVQSQATAMFSSIRGKVNLEVDPRAQAQVQKLSANLAALQANMRALNQAAAPAASAVNRVTTSLNAAAAAGSSATSGLRSAAASTRQVGQAAVDSSYSMQEFGRQVALAGRRFIAFSAAAGTMFAVTRAIKEGITEAVQFDLQLNKLRQVSGDTAGEVRKVGDEVMRLSTSLGASSTDLLEAAVTLKQAGLATKDVKTALEGIAQASLAPNFSSMKQITEGAIAGFQQFGKEVRNIKEQLGAMNAVAGDFAVEASDLVTAVQKAGGTASQTGAQFNELLAIFTSVRSTTRESADSISTGLRTIFTRLQRNDTVDSLRQLGINLRYTRGEAEALSQTDMEGQFVGAYEAVRRLSEGLSKIRTTDPRFASAIEELGGYRQVSRVIPMIQQFGEAQKALNTARLGSASLEAAAATRQDAIATKIAKTREEFQKFSNELVASRGFKTMVDSVLTLATGFAKVLDVAKPLLPVLMALGAVKVVSGALQFGTGLYQGATGQLGGTRAPVRRFAIGGVVPGVGSGDTVPAQLEPGEFVIRKASAQKIGYDQLYAMNAQRFASGGSVKKSVVTQESVKAILREYQQKTGIDFSKVAQVGITNSDGLKKVFGASMKASGVGDGYGVFTKGKKAFGINGPSILLNRSSITSLAQLREVLAHELGHAVDNHLNKGNLSGAGTDTAKYGAREAALQKKYDRAGGELATGKFGRYKYSAVEGFANTFASHLNADPDESFRSKLNRRGFTSLLDDAARATNADYKPSLLTRAKVGISRFFRRFADGGKVDALLTPGEFVIDKKTAAGLGPDALDRMNKYGEVPRFATGGPVLRYATGGAAHDLNSIIGGILGKMAVGRDGAERASEAGLRIARAVAAGKLPTDPKALETFLLKEASQGAKAAEAREGRLRKRYVTGATNASGGAVVDMAAARAAGADGTVPLSKETRAGRQSLADRQYRDREAAVLSRLEGRGLSGDAMERAYSREMAGVTTRGRANTGPVPVLPAAQGLGPLAAPSAGSGQPPVPPRPVAVGPAPDDGRQGNWKSVYQGAYRDARRGGLDAYQSRATAIVALDAQGYGPQAVAAVGTLGSRTNDRRSQRASAAAGPDRDPNDFRRVNPYGAGAFQGIPRGLAPDTGTAGARSGASGFQRLNFVSAAGPFDRIPLASALPATYGFAPAGATSAVPFGRNAPIPLASTFADRSVPGDNTSFARRVQIQQEGAAAEQRRQLSEREKQRADRAGLRALGLRTGGAADLADIRTTSAVNAQGGAALLSTQTLLATQQAQHAKVEQELTRGIQRQLTQLTPAITSAEAYRKAQEMAARAMEQNAAVIRNSRGQAVGLASLGQDLQNRGMPATGGATAGPFLGLRDRAAAAGSWAKRAFTPQGGMMGAYGLMMAGPMIADQFGPSQQSLQTAALTGNSAGVKTGSAAATGASMAAMGAGVGAMFGPWGMAIGAAAGGLMGLVQGWKQADKDIREAKVGQALQNLGDMLTNAANNVRGGLNTLNPTGVRQELDVLRGEAETKTRDATERSWYNPLRLRSATSLSASDVAAVRTRETRAALGGQAGAMMTLLARESDDLAKKNPGVKASELGRRLGADPAASQLVSALAQTRGVPVGTILKEFTDNIRTAQRRLRVEEDIRKGQTAADRSATALSRLTDAVSNAAASVGKFETSMTVLGSVFSGQGGTGRVTSIGTGFATLGTGTGEEFRRSAGALGEALGGSGGSFLRSTSAADQIARALPGVFNSLAAQPLGDDDSYGKRARDLLRAQFLPGMNEAQQKAALKGNPVLDDAIESALSSIVRLQEESKGNGGLAQRLKDDAGKVAQEVADAFAGPLREAAQRMAREVEDNANKFAEGLAAARGMLATAGESADRAGEMRLGARRAGAEIYGDRTGRNATDLLSLRDLQAPFADRQARLAGGIGEDPAAIAARLRQVTEQIAQATQARDNAVGSRNGFAAAAGNLDRLIGTSNNLQTALRNLANASERAAGLQEKLTAASANRDGRLGYAEKYLFADDEGRARMQRGQELVIGLDRGRTAFNGLSADEQRLAAETLGDFGQTRLASGRTAAGLRQQLIGGMPGVTDAGQEADRRGLQDQLVGVFQTAEEAQRSLGAFQQDTHARFISDLRSLHEQFFARLGTNLASEGLNTARNRLAGAAVDQGGQQRELRQREALAKLGVRDQTGLTALRGSRSDVETYLRTGDELRVLRARTPAADLRDALRGDLTNLGDDLRGGMFELPKTERLQDLLRSRGLSDLSAEGQSQALRVVTDRMRKFGETPEGKVQWATMSDMRRLDTLENAVRAGLRVGTTATESGLLDQQERAGRNLEQRGVGARALGELPAADRAAVRGALTGPLNLDTLDQRVKDTADAMERFREQVKAAETALRDATAREGAGVVPIRRADGGFTPRGTDTVPAMLTPGEFVINRASTQANLGLLRHINAAKGAVQYRADGGWIDKGVEGFVWANQKMNAAARWLGFSQGGVAYLADGGDVSEAERAWLRASAADNAANNPGRPGPLVGGGSAALLGLGNSQASYRAYLREKAERARLRGAQPAGPRAMTPEEALAANRAMNAQSMGFSQALARSGMDEGQVQAAAGAVDLRRAQMNRLFVRNFGAATAHIRMRDTEGFRVGAGVRAWNNDENRFRRGEAEYRKWLGSGAGPKGPNSPAARRVSPVGQPQAFLYATGGHVPGSGKGDTVPAMLTPGEFVFSQPAVAALGAGNLDRVHRFAAGGQVPGGSGGGGPGASGLLGLSQEARAAMDQFAGHTKDLGVALTGFSTPAKLLTEALHGFGGGVEKFAGAVDRIPREIELQTRGAVEVVVTGADFVGQAGGALGQHVAKYVMSKIDEAFDARLPDLPRPHRAGPTPFT